MKLKELTLENFKGIEKFDLLSKGDIIRIFGDNATGKSTVFDGFTYLMFGKDSLNSATFDIKTLQSDGEPKHNLEHSVEGSFSDPDIKLKRVFKEIWRKKRGTRKTEFSGHTTEFFIDDVPKKKKEFEDAVNSICDETLFKLLTNPRHFNEIMHWQDRRNILVEVCGNIADGDVLDTLFPSVPDKDDRSNLANILNKHTIDDHRKLIKSQQKKINDELEKIPVRIDEVNKGKDSTRDPAEIQDDIDSAKGTLKDAEGVLEEIKSGGESEVLTTELRKVENKIQEIENEEAAARLQITKNCNASRQKLKNEINDIQRNINTLNRYMNELKSENDDHKKKVDRLEKAAEQFRLEWYDINSKTYEFNAVDICPTCQQKIPQSQIEESKQHGLDAFNKNKAERLVNINNEGKAVVSRIDIIQRAITENDRIILGKIGEVENLEHKRGDLAQELENIIEPEPVDSPEKKALLRQKEDLEIKIQEKKGSVDPESIKTGEAQIEGIKLRIKGYEKELLQIEANKRIIVRIDELSEQEKKLSVEYERLEGELNMIENFIRTKTTMLEEKINSRFKITRWKLFENQINEGLNEICVATIDGVPYPSMNNAARINVGLDICNTLSEYYQKWLPIFIDNCEAISHPIETKAQQIRLIVTDYDKELRVE